MFSSYKILLVLSIFVEISKNVDCYSKVLTVGSSDSAPKIYKAMNMDLIFPKTFNSSENVISTTQTPSPQRFNIEPVESLLSTTEGQFTPGYSSYTESGPATEPTPGPTNHYNPSFVVAGDSAATAAAADDNEDNHADIFDKPTKQEMMTMIEMEDEGNKNEATLPPPATGRAVDYRPAYPFSQLLTSNSKGYSPSAERLRLVAKSPGLRRPTTTGQQRVVYPSYQAPRIPSRAEIDKLSGKGKFTDRFTPAEGVASNTFKLRQNRKPSINRPIGLTSNKVSSFLPTQGQDLYAFPPNLNSRYPAPSDSKQPSPSDTITSYLPPPAGPLDNGQFVGPVNPDLLPDAMKSPPTDEAKDSSGGSGYQYDPPKASEDGAKPAGGDVGYQYNPPPAAPMDDSQDDADQGPPADVDDGMDMAPEAPPPAAADDDHHDHHHHEIGGYVVGKEYPTPPPGYFEEHDHSHDYHHHHHPDIEFSHSPIFHDHHSHDYPDIVFDDYHDHHIHHPLPMTTEPPPPPPAPEPRVKKYSYFYIGRKLWYIPLYFTVWFTFYVLWLILKSIARHKVNLPNHYVSRRSIDPTEHREAREAIDKLTVRVMDGIEKFKHRYVG